MGIDPFFQQENQLPRISFALIPVGNVGPDKNVLLEIKSGVQRKYNISPQRTKSIALKLK